MTKMYSTKRISAYGEPNLCRVHSIIKKIDDESSVLIVNANDGKYVIPFLKYTKNITCYEENSILLNGGKYFIYLSK